MSGLCSEVHEELHFQILSIVRGIVGAGEPVRRILDVGCWDGIKSAEYARAAGLSRDESYGVDCFDDVLASAGKRINAFKVDLETGVLPFEDGFFDIVVCNQVFEHLKQIYRPMSEIRRVLLASGTLIFSVPNLASLHNRIMLGMGLQPTSIRVIGPHVRAFTARAVREFLEVNGLFQVEKQVGVGFYPLPMKLARSLAKCFPSLSHTVICVARKTAVSDLPEWHQLALEESLQTNYE